MATWAEFANAEPDLAAFAWERMEGRIVYQATLRLDGGPRVHPVSPWLGAGLLWVSFRDTSPKMREVARDARYALHTALPWEDHAGEHGEFMVRGWLEQIPPSHPAVTARPGQTPYGLVHYTCSIEDAVATEYSDDESTVEAVLTRRVRVSRRGVDLDVARSPVDPELHQPVDVVRIDPGPSGHLLARVLTHGSRS